MPEADPTRRARRDYILSDDESQASRIATIGPRW
jgi:hypothetical protein